MLLNFSNYNDSTTTCSLLVSIKLCMRHVSCSELSSRLGGANNCMLM